MQSDMDAETGRIILHRDRVLLTLRRLLDTHRSEARGAGRRLAAQIRSRISELNAAKRRRAKETRALLELAKDYVLREQELTAPSPFDPARDIPDGVVFMHAPPVPVWVERVYRATGRFDTGVKSLFLSLVGHLRNAQRGRIGDYQVKRKINLKRTSALDAYVFAISALWSQGRYTGADVRRGLDPKKATDTAATPAFAVWMMLEDLEREDRGSILDRARWWNTAFLVALVLDPEFNSKGAGLGALTTYFRPGGAFDRDGLLSAREKRGAEAGSEVLWFWAERAAIYLNAASWAGRASRGQTGSRGARDPHELGALLDELRLLLPLFTDVLGGEKAGGKRQSPLNNPSTGGIGEPEPAAARSPSPNEVDARDAHSFEGVDRAPPSDRPGNFEQFDRFEVNEASRTLVWGGRTCMVTADREWALLLLLADSPGEPRSVQHVLRHIWGVKKPTALAVSSLVDRLRKRLKAAGFPENLVHSRRRGWYVIDLPAHAQLVKAPSGVASHDLDQRRNEGVMKT